MLRDYCVTYLAGSPGIIFLLIDKRPWVKFHAAQSIVVFGGLTVLRIALAIMGGITGAARLGIYSMLSLMGWLTWFFGYLLMVKAYQHETVQGADRVRRSRKESRTSRLVPHQNDPRAE